MKNSMPPIAFIALRISKPSLLSENGLTTISPCVLSPGAPRNRSYLLFPICNTSLTNLQSDRSHFILFIRFKICSIAAIFLRPFRWYFFTAIECAVLLTGMLVAFLVSIISIRFLMSFIKKHDFRIFGWYRIALAAAAAIYFGFIEWWDVNNYQDKSHRVHFEEVAHKDATQ